MNGKSASVDRRSPERRSQTGEPDVRRDVPSRRNVRGLRPPAVPAYERLYDVSARGFARTTTSYVDTNVIR